jgi:RNA polymerase sigma factor (sigma-70 family)
MQPESTTVASRDRRTRRSRADERAYETFHASHYRELAAYCMTDLRNWFDAQQVAADALVVLWRNWHRLRSHDTRTLQAYVFQVARRNLLHVTPKLRRQRQEMVPLGWGTSDLDDDPALVDPASRGDTADAVAKRVARRLHVALRKLELDEQAAVLRRYGDRRTIAEVADELGTTEAAAGVLMRRALRVLRAHLIGVPT